MRPEAFAYVAAGAGNETTLAANRAAFDRWRIVPRMLRDVERATLGRAVRARGCRHPFLLAPIGVLGLAHPEADCASPARPRTRAPDGLLEPGLGADGERAPDAAPDSPRWFQLYWSRSDELVGEPGVTRAERCGCEAIVVTLDTTMLGLALLATSRSAYLPFLHGKGIAQYTERPGVPGT